MSLMGSQQTVRQRWMNQRADRRTQRVSLTEARKQKRCGRHARTGLNSAASAQNERQGKEQNQAQNLLVSNHPGTRGSSHRMATPKSRPWLRPSPPRFQAQAPALSAGFVFVAAATVLAKGRAVLCLLGGVFYLATSFAGAQDTKNAEVRLIQARRAWTQQPTNESLGVAFAQATFDRAEFSTVKSERADLANQGIQAAREVLSRNSNSAPAHLLLALNLGQLARTRHLSALGIVSEMEVHFLASIRIDPKFQHACAARSLGMLYLQAPGWPTSLGSRSKARQYLQLATDLASDYPENLLTLLETEVKWGEKRKVAARLGELEAVMTRAQTALTGPDWEPSWRDWKDRAQKLRAQTTASR